MRNAFADEITKLGHEDQRIVLLSGDIGNRLFDTFKAAAPGRFINAGIAEANMMGMAAGLALSGLRPVVYTITPFATTRCLEQIKIDICYHRVPVIIVGTGSGLSYGELGPTHHSCEDIAILRAMPEMTVVCPADGVELRAALNAALAQDKPVYLRIGKKGEPDLHASLPDFQLGKMITMQGGADLCLIATGNMVASALETAKFLAERGLTARVESMPTVKPLDEARLGDLFARFPLIAVAEEHGPIGGLFGAIAEWGAGRPGTRLLRLSAPDAFPHFVGSQEWLREQAGLTPPQMARAIEDALVQTRLRKAP